MSSFGAGCGSWLIISSRDSGRRCLLASDVIHFINPFILFISPGLTGIDSDSFAELPVPRVTPLNLD